MVLISKKRKDNRKGMGSSHVSGSNDRNQGTKVISDHGMGTQALAQSNKQT